MESNSILRLLLVYWPGVKVEYPLAAGETFMVSDGSPRGARLAAKPREAEGKMCLRRS